MLFTSEPVRTLEHATAVVDHYRARWLIEEYSGCMLVTASCWAVGKCQQQVVTAGGRELLGFIWAIGVTVAREQRPRPSAIAA